MKNEKPLFELRTWSLEKKHVGTGFIPVRKRCRTFALSTSQLLTFHFTFTNLNCGKIFPMGKIASKAKISAYLEDIIYPATKKQLIVHAEEGKLLRM